jgi:ABC-type sulfate/molybdate transport systems ATPase subunit
MVELLGRVDELPSSPAVVLVTHAFEEASMLAPRLLVLEGGRPLFLGPAERALRAPGSVRLAELLELGVLLRGRCVDGRVETFVGPVEVKGAVKHEGRELTLLARPTQLRVGPSSGPGATGDARVLGAAALTGDGGLELWLQIGAELLRAKSARPLAPGTRVAVRAIEALEVVG